MSSSKSLILILLGAGVLAVCASFFYLGTFHVHLTSSHAVHNTHRHGNSHNGKLVPASGVASGTSAASDVQELLRQQEKMHADFNTRFAAITRLLEAYQNTGGTNVNAPHRAETKAVLASPAAASPAAPAPPQKNLQYQEVPHYWEDSEGYEFRKSAQKVPTDRFLLFQTWGGGFNNERMSVEQAVALAFVMERTLVMPPVYNIYLLERSTLTDYIDMHDLRKIVPVLTWAEFSQKHPTYGLKENSYDNVEKLPGIRIVRENELENNGVFCWPSVPKTGTPEYDRMQKWATGKGPQRMEMTPDMKAAQFVYFARPTLFAHFYTFMYFQSSHLAQERQLKSLIKRYFHLREEMLERADRILALLPKSFSAMHIRHGDFQHKDIRNLNGDIIARNTKALLQKGEVVYVATDDTDTAAMQRDFYTKLAAESGVVVKSLADFTKVLGEDRDTPKRWYGMIDMLVCTRARVFVGTRLSTFSGYIYRMRGYMDDIEDKSLYLTNTKFPEGYHQTTNSPPWAGLWSSAVWGREYSAAWEDWEQPRVKEYWVKN